MIKPQTAQMDDLTGLFTRKTFQEVFDQVLAQAKASSDDQPLSLALMDIDQFLHINEHFGHLAGDHVIQAVAETIRQMTDEKDLGFRYGGDEFAVLFLGLEREQAFLKAEQIRLAMAQRELKTERDQVIQGVAVSIGVASFPVDGRSTAELLRKADHALYRAKVAGRNQVRLAFEERMVPKTSHYTQTQLERLTKLAEERGVSEADLLREAMDDLLTKYGVNDIES